MPILGAVAVAFLAGALAGAVIGALTAKMHSGRSAPHVVLALSFVPWLLHLAGTVGAPRMGTPDEPFTGPVPGAARFVAAGLLLGAALLAGGLLLASRAPRLAWMVPPALFTLYYRLVLNPFAEGVSGLILLDNTPNVLLFLLCTAATGALIVLPWVGRGDGR